MRDPHKEITRSKHQSTTCIPTTWKILLRLQDNMSHYLSMLQRGIGNKTRGSKYQLFIDRHKVFTDQSVLDWLQESL